METTVVKALKVLEVLSSFDRPASLAEIARLCGLTKSNAHRLLKTLEQGQCVRQHERTKEYELTLRLWELGVPVYDRLDLRAVAAPQLIKLAKATNESVHLSVLEGGEAVYVDKVDCTHAVRAYIRVGERAPAYCVATGKAMLAFQSKSVIDLACRCMRRFTHVTTKSRRALDKELAAIRLQGHVTTFGEWREGVIGVAAPIWTAPGVVGAGIGIAGPADRMRKADPDRMALAVKRAAEQVSESLGGRPDRAAADAVVVAAASARPELSPKKRSGRQ